MWSVNTRPKASVSSAGGCFGVVVRVMAIWVKAVSLTLKFAGAASYAGSTATSWPLWPRKAHPTSECAHSEPSFDTEDGRHARSRTKGRKRQLVGAVRDSNPGVTL